MDKYRRIIDPEKQNAIFPNESHVLRINVSGKLSTYIAYAEKRLEDDALAKVDLVALGRAINRAVTVAEILRRNHPGVHQLTTLRSVSMRDRFIPLEEGLRELELDRTSSCISILIAKSAAGMDTAAPGYAPPQDVPPEHRISPEAVAEMDQERAGSSARRGRAAAAAAAAAAGAPARGRNGGGRNSRRGRRGRAAARKSAGGGGEVANGGGGGGGGPADAPAAGGAGAAAAGGAGPM